MVGFTFHEAVDGVSLELTCSGKSGSGCVVVTFCYKSLCQETRKNARSLHHWNNHSCVSCLEGTQSIVELAHAAATTDGKVSGDAPLIFIIRNGKGRNYGSRCLTLETMSGVGVFGVILEERESRLDVALLESRLVVEAQVPSVLEESTTSRVGVDTCDVNLTFLSEVTNEGCILIGVGQETTCKCVTNCGKSHQNKCCFFHFLP